MEVTIDGIRYVPELKQSKDKGLLAALEVRFSSDAGDDLTIREYLRMLLMAVWDEGEEFSGKRPFGNSDWENDIYAPLVKSGFIAGTVDQYGCAIFNDIKGARAYVQDLILVMCHGVPAGPDKNCSQGE